MVGSRRGLLNLVYEDPNFVDVHCAECGDVIWDCGDDLFFPLFHFCCCGRCSWSCSHDHPAHGPSCHMESQINHSQEFILPVMSGGGH